MRFFSLLAAASSLLTSYAAAQDNLQPLAITYPLSGTFNAGDQVTITWKTTTAPSVMLQLRYGSNSGNLATGPPIAADIPNSGSFPWTIPSDIVSYTYSIQITDTAGTTNYSPVFTVTGGTGVLPASSYLTAKPTTTAALPGASSMTTTTSAALSTSSSSSSSTPKSSASKTSSSGASSTSSSTSAATSAPTTGDGVRVGHGGSLAAVLGLGALIALA